MNAYDYINSKDIRSHLKKINYEFSAFEMAYLIHHSESKTLAEKLAAMRSLLSEMNDHEIPYRVSGRTVDSTRELIKGYIELMSKRRETFSESKGFWFCLERSYHDPGQIGPKGYVDAIFPTFEECLSHLRMELRDEQDTSDICAAYRPESRFKVSKLRIASNEREAYVVLNQRLKPMAIKTKSYSDDVLGECEWILDNGHIQIPIPFQRGDIVIDSSDPNARPFVFTDLKCWDSTTLEQHGTHLEEWQREKRDERIAKNNECNSWDASHMVAMGYERGSWNTLGASNEFTIWEDDFGAAHNYLDLEFHREPLTGLDRLLAVVSEHEKGRLDVETTINLTSFLLFDSCAEEIGSFISDFYIRQIKELTSKKIEPTMQAPIQ